MNTEKLILLVRGVDAIYNPRHPKHHDRKFIAGAWRQIGEELNLSDVEAKAKWQNLRSNYMREKRKLKNARSVSDGNIAPKLTWPYFQLLTFLDRTLKHRAKSKNVPDVASSARDEKSEEPIADSQRPKRESHPQSLQEPQTSQSSTQANYSRRKKKRQMTRTETKKDIDKQYLMRLKALSKKSEDDKDPDLLFLRSLLPSIKQLRPLENLEFKAEVLNLLKSKLEVSIRSPSAYSSGSSAVVECDAIL